MRSLFIILIFQLAACSGYVNRVYDQIDKENDQGKFKKKDKFDLYRNPKMISKNKQFNDQRGNTEDTKNYHPAVKRQYLPQELIKKRYTSEDLVDSKPEGSLWVANDSNAFLFSEDSKKRNGDIVLINVKAELKNEITAALKKAFPDAPKKAKPEKEGEAAASTEKAKKPKEKEETPAAEEQVVDKISSVIIEEINRDHLLLRGRKTILYKGNKKAVEIQALVSRKDVSTEDSIDSNNILETTVNVVR